MGKEFWVWFKTHGDDVFVFIGFAGELLKDEKGLGLSEITMNWIGIIGLLAGLAHKVFYPASQQTLNMQQKELVK